jgi:plastocyanin
MKNKTNSFFAVLIVMLFISGVSNSRTVSVTASNFVFTPAVVNAVVGDTIKWTRSSGSHTTTCDGQQGTSRPAGAAPWNAPLTSGNPTFIYVITVPGQYQYICEPHAPDMAGVINATASSISQINEIVTGFEISQNYPNPFNPSTKISFAIPSNEFVTLKIFNELGKEVESLVSSKLSAGTYEADWNAANLNSGVYYYRLQAGSFSQTRKMLLVK